MPTIASFLLETITACPRLRVLDPVERGNHWSFQHCVHANPHNDSIKLKVDFDDVDVALFLRHMNVAGYRGLLEELKRRSIPVIYDLDDDFFNIDRTHSHYEFIAWLKPNIMDLLELADVVVTTNEGLRDVYAPHTKRVEVIRNTIDTDIWKRSCRWSAGGPTIIGYAGTTTHEADLMMIEDVLLDTLDRYDVILKLRCCSTEALEGHPKVIVDDRLIYDYHDFAADYETEDVDIAIAPLLNQPFNNVKSGIKWKEYSIGSIPGVYSRIPAYERLVNQGETGFLATSADEWRQALETLITDVERRHAIGRKSRQLVLDSYTVSTATMRWEELLDEIYQAGPVAKIERPAPKVTVIVPVFNRKDLTRQCLTSLMHSIGEIDFEIVVVDNASSDGTAEYLQGFVSKVKVITNEDNLGFAKANNQAALQSRSEFLVLLNNDTEVEKGWLEALVNCQEETGASLVGGRLMYPDDSIQHAGVALYDHDDKPHALYPGVARDNPLFERISGHRRPMQIVTAACWLVSRQHYLDIGGLDEKFINGYEDVDFCLRLRSIGGAVWYEPGCTIMHHESKTPGRGKHSADNEKLLFERHRDTWQHDYLHYVADDGLAVKGEGKLGENVVLMTNLEVLARTNPEWAKMIDEWRFGSRRLEFEVVEDKTVRCQSGGRTLFIHSKRNPEREAERFAEQAVQNAEGATIHVAGFGFAWHLEALLERMMPEQILEISCLEPLILRLAFENRDLTKLLSDPRLKFVRRVDIENATMLPGYTALLQPTRKAS